MADVTVWFNPRCSKCRTTRDLLDEEGVTCELVEYLDDTPTRDEIVRVLGLLGFDDPRSLMRTGEGIYQQLNLAGAEGDALIDAMVAHPVLIERPVVIRGDRAVIARPPERVRELL